MRTLLRAASALVVAALVLAACGDDDDVVSSGGSSSSIDGDYLAIEVTEGGQAKALVEGTTISLRLHDGALTANAGCNTIGGDYTVDGDVLRARALSTTEMGCDPPRHAQDEWLAALLSSGPTVEPGDQGFVLRTDSVTLTFVDREVADPDRELVGTTWVVDGYLDGAGPDGTASSAMGDQALVRFEENGFMTGHDGCNGFGYAGQMGADPTDGLRYEVDGDRITFSGSAAHTEMACPDVDTDRIWAVLSGTVTWTVDGPGLTLVAADDRGVTFRAQDG